MGMTNRERVKAILHYQPVDRVPVVAFGYWNETLEKWAREGHITQAQCDGYYDNSPADNESCKNWALISTGILAWAEM